MACELCDAVNEDYRVVLKDEHSFAMIILHPQVELHSLVLPRRHVTSLDELGPEESRSLHTMVERIRKTIQDIMGYSCITVLHGTKMASQKHIHYQILPLECGGIRTLVSQLLNIAEYPEVNDEVRQRMAETLRMRLELNGIK